MTMLIKRVGREMNEDNDQAGSSLFDAIVAGVWTGETLPEIVSGEQRTIYQRAADALERNALPRSQEFDREQWLTWLGTLGGRLCTAIDERILCWDSGK